MSPALRLGWRVASLALLAACLFFVWESWKLELFDRLGPGAGFFPFWLGLIGAALSLLLLVEAGRRAIDDDEGGLLPRGVAAWRVAAILGAIGLAALLIEPLGFRLTALLFVGVLLPILGARAPLAIAAVALAGSFGVYLVFNDWLDVILPVGPLGL